MGIIVCQDLCNGCGLCVRSCSFAAIQMAGRFPVIDEAACVACGACLDACPQAAIIDDAATVVVGETPDAESYKGILIYAEQERGALKKVALELTSEARRLADILQTEVNALLLGEHVASLAEQLFAYGADKVFMAESADLKDYRTEAFCWAAEQAVRMIKPEIMLIGATTEGRDLAPRLAVRLHTGLTADCTKLDIDTEQRHLLQTRPAFGGNIFATIICPDHRPQMATVRPGVLPAVIQAGRSGQVEALPLDFSQMPSIRTQIKQVVSSVAEAAALEDAEIIVAGGRGVGSSDGFAVICEAAKRLNAAFGASRAAVEAGWVEQQYQIGQTGKTVSPKIYIACGVSGAIQHQAGMSKSGTIIAINRDKNALIFNIADYGLVGDLHNILPVLTEELAVVLEKRKQGF